ncbi:DUF3987 domain-containing protein [Lyngbya sp. CCY1209]|uniref:DUF3987 domain-containing protein n=1 Tax=Lyngbya sp. CCY1209 TaxID=2886103 RepID=UPI002D217994|nr:DUF3987 domain-containing protein [Lyngbya sp. CCY1209]MEB3886151.1 DUF3987 domain-containing protein [Lyngbya sp. CCY1209]
MNKPSTQELIAGLSQIPDSFILTPVRGSKAPYRKNWQHEKPCDRDTIEKDIETGRAKGYGLRTGAISGGIVAVDCDGEPAHKLAESSGGLPPTVSFTSNKPGRAQYLYQIPESEWGNVETRKIKTGQKGDDGKEVLLELRWNGCQSVLPPSVHPETGQYQWINSPGETAIAEAPRWVIEQMRDNTGRTETPLLNSITSDDIPLTICLAIETRNLIESGSPDGRRGDDAIRVAQDLLGTYERLQYLGYPVKDRPEDLFEQYCDRCNPPLEPERRKSTWKSAQRRNPTPCLSDDKIENCVRAYWKQLADPSGVRGGKPSQSDRSFSLIKGGKDNDLEEAIEQVIESGASGAQLKATLAKIAQATGISPTEVYRIYQARIDEIEQEETREECKQAVEELLSFQHNSLEVEKFLPPALHPIFQIYRRMALRPEIALMHLITATASLLPPESRIDLLDYTNHSEPFILFTLVCAVPSQRKTPGLNQIISKPFKQLQKELNERHELEHRDWKKRQKQAEDADKQFDEPEPQLRLLAIHRATQAALRNLLAHNPRWGCLLVADEFSGEMRNIQKSYNQGFAEDILSLYNGDGRIEAKAEEIASNTTHSNFNLCGNIQPEVFEEFSNGRNDASGWWSRFSIIRQPISPMHIPETRAERENLPKLNVQETLVEFYRQLLKISEPVQLRLSEKAQDYFARVYNRADVRRVEYAEKNPAIASQWGKLPGKVGRIAGNLHIIHCLGQGQPITEEISPSTLKLAVKLAKFLINEITSVYAEADKDNHEALLSHIVTLSQKRGAVKASDCQQRIRSLRGVKPDQIRAYFDKLAEIGLGTIEGSGARRKFKADESADPKILDARPDSRPTLDTDTDTPESPPDKEPSPHSRPIDTIDAPADPKTGATCGERSRTAPKPDNTLTATDRNGQAIAVGDTVTYLSSDDPKCPWNGKQGIIKEIHPKNNGKTFVEGKFLSRQDSPFYTPSTNLERFEDTGQALTT